MFQGSTLIGEALIEDTNKGNANSRQRVFTALASPGFPEIPQDREVGECNDPLERLVHA